MACPGLPGLESRRPRAECRLQCACPRCAVCAGGPVCLCLCVCCLTAPGPPGPRVSLARFSFRGRSARMRAASGRDAPLQAMLTLGWLTLAVSAGEPPRRRGGGSRRAGVGRGGWLGSGRSLLTCPARAGLLLGPGFVVHTLKGWIRPGGSRPSVCGSQTRDTDSVAGHAGTVVSWRRRVDALSSKQRRCCGVPGPPTTLET